LGPKKKNHHSIRITARKKRRTMFEKFTSTRGKKREKSIKGTITTEKFVKRKHNCPDTFEKVGMRISRRSKMESLRCYTSLYRENIWKGILRSLGGRFF